MNLKESFIHDCQALFTRTEGNLVDVPDIENLDKIMKKTRKFIFHIEEKHSG